METDTRLENDDTRRTEEDDELTRAIKRERRLEEEREREQERKREEEQKAFIQEEDRRRKVREQCEDRAIAYNLGRKHERIERICRIIILVLVVVLIYTLWKKYHRKPTPVLSSPLQPVSENPTALQNDNLMTDALKQFTQPLTVSLDQGPDEFKYEDEEVPEQRTNVDENIRLEMMEPEWQFGDVEMEVKNV